MRCSKVRWMLSPYLDGALGPGQADQIELHLEGCPTCRQEMASLAEAWELLPEVTRIEPPPSFPERLLTRISTLPAESSVQFIPLSRLWRELATWVVVSCGLVGLFLGVFLGGKLQPNTTVDSTPRTAIAEQASNVRELDFLADVPRESLGGSYLQISSAEPPQTRR